MQVCDITVLCYFNPLVLDFKFQITKGGNLLQNLLLFISIGLSLSGV